MDPAPDPGARRQPRRHPILFELEERLGARILEALYAEGMRNRKASEAVAASEADAETV